MKVVINLSLLDMPRPARWKHCHHLIKSACFCLSSLSPVIFWHGEESITFIFIGIHIHSTQSLDQTITLLLLYDNKDTFIECSLLCCLFQVFLWKLPNYVQNCRVQLLSRNRCCYHLWPKIGKEQFRCKTTASSHHYITSPWIHAYLLAQHLNYARA